MRLRLLAAVALFAWAAVAAAEDRFAVAGLTEAEARTFFTALQSALRARNDEHLADLIEFPLMVNHEKGKRRMTVTRAGFLADPEAVFPERVRKRVLAQKFSDVFVNWRGAMLANGTVWFSGICDEHSPPGECREKRLRIVAVDQDAPR